MALSALTCAGYLTEIQIEDSESIQEDGSEDELDIDDNTVFVVICLVMSGMAAILKMAAIFENLCMEILSRVHAYLRII